MLCRHATCPPSASALCFSSVRADGPGQRARRGGLGGPRTVCASGASSQRVGLECVGNLCIAAFSRVTESRVAAPAPRLGQPWRRQSMHRGFEPSCVLGRLAVAADSGRFRGPGRKARLVARLGKGTIVGRPRRKQGFRAGAIPARPGPKRSGAALPPRPAGPAHWAQPGEGAQLRSCGTHGPSRQSGTAITRTPCFRRGAGARLENRSESSDG